MEVLFLTRRTDHVLNDNPLITQTTSAAIAQHWLLTSKALPEDELDHSGWLVIGNDIENRYELPSKDGLLLSAFCIDGNKVLVIDNTSVNNIEVFDEELLKYCLFIAHNADHEARWGVTTKFLPERFACTLVNGKRLLSGQEGYRFDLMSEINRHLGYEAIPQWMDKDVRSRFKDCTYFDDELILYNACDTIKLKQLYYTQRDKARKLGQLYLHNSLNSRIIIPIAKAEEKGFKHRSDKWIEIVEDKKSKVATICQDLDRIIVEEYQVNPALINPILKKQRDQQEKGEQRLKERKLKLEAQIKNFEEKSKTHLKSYKTTVETYHKIVMEASSVNNVDTGTVLINWGSPKQVLDVFKAISCPLPTAKDGREMKDSLKKEARNNWFVLHSDSSFYPLMKQFDNFKKIEHNIKSFGLKWLDQYVRNGRAYTSLDQAGTETGRFSSGSKGTKNKLYYNSQQIPAREGKEYRECFIADEGRRIITLDYTNCEGNIMAALSRDLNMQKIIQIKDSHSYLGTLAWRAVYEYRYNKTKDPKWLELSQTYEMNKSTPEKEKERDVFKNSGGLFPVCYGSMPNKVAATSKITEAEGAVMINTIKSQVPAAIEFLDSKSLEAVTNGYVVHNTRSGSIRWFSSIIDAAHYGWKLTNTTKVEVELAARNSPIQAGNSDLLKEAMAMIEAWAKLYKQDVNLLLCVHDELVYDVPEEHAEFLADKIKELMKRAANNYLIPEIKMDVDCRISDHWKK